MHSRKVFVFTDVNYGASKTSATAETALNPADLADGAIALYGIHEAGATNLNKLVLITDGGSEAAGKVPAGSFVGSKIFVAMGTSAGHQQSNPIDLPYGLNNHPGGKTAYVYSAPVKGVHKIGYNGVSGSTLSLPATIINGADFTIGINNKNYFIAGDRQPGVSSLMSTQGRTGDTPYTLLKRWIVDTVARNTNDLLISKTSIKITDNGTGAAFANSATVTAVNGATSLTTSAAHGVGVGDYVRLDGDYYQAVTGTTGSTLVLDRPYQGPSATIANANTVDLGASASTELGIQFTEKDNFMNTNTFVQGIITNSSQLKSTASSGGAGSYQEILALEKEALPKKGTEDLITSYIPKDVTRANPALTYDTYVLKVRNVNFAGGDQGAVFKIINYLTLAFPSTVADTGGKNQSNFEDVMTSLFTTFPTLF